MAKKSFPKHSKKSTKGNGENDQNVDSENVSDTKTKSPKKYVILNRKQKPMACVQPQQSLQSNISSNSTAVTVTTILPTILATASAPKQENNLKNSCIYQGQRLINLSTITPVSPPHLCHLSYQPFTCPVINWNYVTSRYVPSPIISYQKWNLPLPTVTVITPVQITSQIVPLLPTQAFANVILPGSSILPFNNLSFFGPGFRYSSQLSAIDYDSCAFPCETSPSLLSLKGSSLYESCIWKNTAQPDDTHTNCTASESIEKINNTKRDPLEFYLKLPEDLFPKIKMLSLDPNPIIDVFCKVSDIDNYEPWLLDLEYGVPRTPVTRPIAIYDVQHNRIHCKNTPGAIHPGFENCSSDFKTVIMFYYDCIISAWYRGYTIMYVDVSVANYQSWLRAPMQAFGMCWP